jgi:hypothetical protein
MLLYLDFKIPGIEVVFDVEVGEENLTPVKEFSCGAC